MRLPYIRAWSADPVSFRLKPSEPPKLTRYGPRIVELVDQAVEAFRTRYGRKPDFIVLGWRARLALVAKLREDVGLRGGDPSSLDSDAGLRLADIQVIVDPNAIPDHISVGLAGGWTP